MKFGEKVQVVSYNNNADKYLRPAEVSFDLGGDCVQVRFLDELFCKGGRSKETVTVLRKLIVEVI